MKTTFRRFAGFSLIELMVTMAVLGILTGLAIPQYKNYVVRAKVAEGLSLMGQPKASIVSFNASHGRLPATFDEFGWPAATGGAFGGDAASFEHVYGFDSDIWRQVEWQPKSGGWILVFRSKRKPEWDNVDIGLHLQVKATAGDVRFRCIVNNNPTRKAWVPPNCRRGNVNDWSW